MESGFAFVEAPCFNPCNMDKNDFPAKMVTVSQLIFWNQIVFAGLCAAFAIKIASANDLNAVRLQDDDPFLVFAGHAILVAANATIYIRLSARLFWNALTSVLPLAIMLIWVTALGDKIGPFGWLMLPCAIGSLIRMASKRRQAPS